MQLNLFSNNDVVLAEKTYFYIKDKLKKYQVDIHMSKMNYQGTISQVEKHLRKLDQYDDYLKEMNDLIKSSISGFETLDEQWKHDINSYVVVGDKLRIRQINFNPKTRWLSDTFTLLHFEQVSIDLFRTIYDI